MVYRKLLSVYIALFSINAAHATVWTATSKTISDVFQQATGGDTIKLVGSFGETKLTSKSFASLVTIDASGAAFSDTLLLNNISNIEVDGGDFGSSTASTAYDAAIAVYGGTNIAFVGPSVTGFYEGRGIVITGTSNVAVTGATLTELQAGVVFYRVANGSISDSRSIAAVADGFDIVDSSQIDIGHNICVASTPTVGSHPDCVQLESSATGTPLTRINIHNNHASGFTQGFDNFGSAPGDSDISIIDNRIDGLMPQGIACNYCTDSTIVGNTITTLAGAPWQVTLNTLYGSDNAVYGNSVGALNKSASKPLAYYTREQLIANAAVAATNPDRRGAGARRLEHDDCRVRVRWHRDAQATQSFRMTGIVPRDVVKLTSPPSGTTT